MKLKEYNDKFVPKDCCIYDNIGGEIIIKSIKKNDWPKALNLLSKKIKELKKEFTYKNIYSDNNSISFEWSRKYTNEEKKQIKESLKIEKLQELKEEKKLAKSLAKKHNLI